MATIIIMALRHSASRIEGTIHDFLSDIDNTVLIKTLDDYKNWIH